MQSNRIYYYLFKYCLLGFSIALVSISLIFWIAPESLTNDGEPGTQDISTTLVFGLIGILFFLLFILVKDKFAIVELGNQAIKINHRGEERTVTWLDVESISQIQFVSPPLYRIKIKNDDETIWFNTESRYISVGDYVTDLGEMGDLIKKKKKELGL